MVIIPREHWGARHPKSVRPMTGFTSGWFIHWLGEPAAAILGRQVPEVLEHLEGAIEGGLVETSAEASPTSGRSLFRLQATEAPEVVAE